MRRPLIPSLRFPVGFALAALFAFNAAVPVFADGTVLTGPSSLRSSAPEVPSAGPVPPVPGSAALPAESLPAHLLFAGPSEASLRAALPDRNLRRMDPDAFRSFVQTHAGQGRFLSGIELAAVLEDRATAGNRAAAAPRTLCDTLPSLARSRCLDSLARRSAADTAGPRALREARAEEAAADSQSIELGKPPASGQDQDRNDAASVDKEEARGWFLNLFADLHDDKSKDGGGLDAHGWAVLIFVVIGFVVVGAFLVYGLQTLFELALNREHYPVFQEAGLRLSYSGEAWRDGVGGDLYRDAYLAGLRYAVGFDRPGADVGLAIEGGYIDIRLRPLDGPGDAFDFRGAYLVAGPLLRFGDYDPMCFSLEFLNGTSNHPSVGWISKARMALQCRVGRHQVIGADLGAVFYDLTFLDGLAWRRGDLNRDLSLIGGVDFGWEF